ncbi:MAG: DNA mismatch repair endonuclease MutL [Kiritimatiellia bacterium]
MQKPRQIRVLPDHVINKIAAGEVVERPAAVLKELLENALDAGGRRIDVIINGGGRDLVSVSDDGCGLGRDEVLLAVERHATSKITDLDDIEKINTLGFRGEALAAIAAVSRFRLYSRPAAEQAGTEMTISAGKIQDLRDLGCPPGTTVEVRNLFFNVPARRKFLRTPATESGHIRHTFLTTALARPETGFNLTMDRRRIYSLPAGDTLEQRLRSLFPGLDYTNLRPLDLERQGVSVSGYASLPALNRADRSEQYFFINGRPAAAPTLWACVQAAYRGSLPAGRHPYLFLFIVLNPGAVDVNVHPTKREVRFHDPRLLRDVCTEALGRALAQPGPARAADPTPSTPATTHPPAAASLPALDHFLRAMSTPPPVRSARPLSTPLSAIGGAHPCPGRPPEPSGAAGTPWNWYQILGTIGGRFVVLETDEGLALLDPHAAHERVLYESLLRQYRERTTAAQPLLSPITVELTPTDAGRLRRGLEALRQMGFGLDEFGEDAFIIDALPVGLEDSNPGTLVREIAALLDEPGAARATLEEGVVRAACHAAVKATHSLPTQQIDALLKQLLAAEMPYTCPHGRPTLINITLQELNRKFGRD